MIASCTSREELGNLMSTDKYKKAKYPTTPFGTTAHDQVSPALRDLGWGKGEELD
jgi:hypothetical protein